jgi:BlaI family transcriptional regulator, penicillinase repressor
MSEQGIPTNLSSEKPRPPRRALLDLAPLELDCLNTLWPMGEGTVREIRDRLAPRLPRAYTTIMTIMDRLARKGIVERKKSGRAYLYRANLTPEEARTQALGHVIEKFFGGSKEALLAQLAGPTQALPLVRAAAAGASGSSGNAPHVTGVSTASPPIESRNIAAPSPEPKLPDK